MKQEQRRYVSQELILAEAIKEFGKYGYGGRFGQPHL